MLLVTVFGPAVAEVVDFEVAGVAAAIDVALVALRQQRHVLGSGDVVLGVGEGADVDAVGEDDVDDGVAGHPAGGGDIDGADPGDLARLARPGVAAGPGGGVGEQDDLDPDLRELGRRVTVGVGVGDRGVGHADEGVGGVLLVAFADAGAAGVLEDLVGEPLEGFLEPGALVGRERALRTGRRRRQGRSNPGTQRRSWILAIASGPAPR